MGGASVSEGEWDLDYHRLSNPANGDSLSYILSLPSALPDQPRDPSLLNWLIQQPIVEAPDARPHNSQCLSAQPIDLSGAAVSTNYTHCLEVQVTSSIGGATGSEVGLDQTFKGLSDIKGGSPPYLSSDPPCLSSDPPSDLPVTVQGTFPHVSVSLARSADHVMPSSDPSELEANVTRQRSDNWSDEEKFLCLRYKVKAVQEGRKGKELWNYISEQLKEGHSILRSAKNCENLWRNAREADRKRDDESSSWNKFLPEPCYELVQKILEAQKQKKILEAQRRRRRQRRQSIVPQRGAYHPWPSHTVRSVVEGDLDTQLSSRHRLELSIAEQSKNAVNSCFENLRNHFSRVDSRNSLAPDIEEKAIAAVKSISYVRIFTSKEGRFDVNDPVAVLAPFTAKHIEDALKEVIAPISSELEALEEIQKRRQDVFEKRRALDRDVIEKRRALDREEKEIEESARRQHAIGRFT